jgi:hypothetical protein
LSVAFSAVSSTLISAADATTCDGEAMFVSDDVAHS